MEFYSDHFFRPGKKHEHIKELIALYQQPSGFWFGTEREWNKRKVEHRVRRLMKYSDPKVPLLVLYNIPNRDLGSYSAGGEKNYTDYLTYIERFARGISNRPAWVVFEPDALAHASTNEKMLRERIAVFNQALPLLNNSHPLARIYVDIGHPHWLGVDRASEILNMVNPSAFDGFSVNVSNFVPTEECIQWGRAISERIGGKPFVIDTSRNGMVRNDHEWCNPMPTALGPIPTAHTGVDRVDAFAWIKIPGESDGNKDGAPNAGTFYLNYALQLMRNSQHEMFNTVQCPRDASRT